MSKARLRRAKAAMAVPDSARTAKEPALSRKDLSDIIALAKAKCGLTKPQAAAILRAGMLSRFFSPAFILGFAKEHEVEDPSYRGIELAVYRGMLAWGLDI